MPLAKNLRRERSLAIDLKTVTFNAPGIYYPPYGKSVFQLSGRGTPGNATVPGNADGGTNSTLYYYYQPASGGNYAGTNPAVPGNYVSTNPVVPGNATGNSNPVVPGNATGNSNPAVPGNISGKTYNAYDAGWYSYDSANQNFFSYPPSTNVFNTIVDMSPVYWDTYSGNVHIVSYFVYDYVSTTYNPATPGNAIYNPATGGNANYNPATGGNANYNPGTPAADYYNPYVPASTPAAYNTGNPNYNPTVSGTTGANYAVLGVPLPGGAIGTPAPIIGYSTIQVDYTTTGIPISVPPGGYVIIQNKQPGT